jgi:hypothetical protein
VGQCSATSSANARRAGEGLPQVGPQTPKPGTPRGRPGECVRAMANLVTTRRQGEAALLVSRSKP